MAVPLGATWHGEGASFALYSRHATEVRLCLFDETGRIEISQLPLERGAGYIWRVDAPDVGPGKRYGYRVSGPYDPEQGHRFNGAKLLIDPYARAMSGTVDWSGPVYGYHRNDFGDDRVPDLADDAASVPKGVVIDNAFDWEDDRPPATPWADTVIYELHVKGTTARHLEVPAALRGTYAGLCHPTVVEHVKRLGVTAIQLLPVQAFVDDELLVARGLRNYWGYSTIGFFAPEARYASRGDGGEQVREFKEMIRTYHRAGIEVLLDVVYNHTGEGTHLGPTLCYRGIDNRTYYRLVPHQARFNENLTGTGNTLNASHPQVLTLIMDSLRYWVEEMHVDGFRFDLAPVLGRDPVDFDTGSSFFDCVHQDPVLSRVKLIAEPWDLGHGGYQLGAFPTNWAEWNDRFRDAARGFWLGHQSGVVELSRRIAGSPDIFVREDRVSTPSVNFVTAHDGFTLRDLVSFNAKHNELNGEDNRDGSDHNLSSNHGVEGLTDEAGVNAIRARQMRNLIATLLLSRGVPMILAGDEFGRSQRGNNNAYCQDNEISWIDWSEDSVDHELLEFVTHVAEIRAEYRRVRSGAIAFGEEASSGRVSGIAWVHPSGRVVAPEDWADGSATALGVLFGAAPETSPAFAGAEFPGTLLVVMNAGRRSVTFRLPPIGEDPALRWLVIVDTSAAGGHAARSHGADRIIRVPDRTVLVCKPTAHRVHSTRRPPEARPDRRRGR